MQTDFILDVEPWRQEIQSLKPGDTLSGARLLALLEGEPEDSVDEAFAFLDAGEISLTVADLPRLGNVGEAALRLRREEELSQKPGFWKSLDETDTLRLFMEEITDTDEDTRLALAEAVARGEEGAAEKLLAAMLPMVTERAIGMTGRGVLLMDLIQEGSLGLWQGILSYRGGDFRKHTLWRIDNAMAKAVLLQARDGGIGQKMRQGMEDFRDVDQRLLTQLGRNPTLEEIAEELHISPEEAKTLEDALVSARMKQRVEAERAPKEPTPEDKQAVEDTAYFQMRQRIEEMLSSLTQQEGKLLTLRFGLEGGLPMSPEDTARQLEMTPEAVLEMEASALKKLRSDKD